MSDYDHVLEELKRQIPHKWVLMDLVQVIGFVLWIAGWIWFALWTGA